MYWIKHLTQQHNKSQRFCTTCSAYTPRQKRLQLKAHRTGWVLSNRAGLDTEHQLIEADYLRIASQKYEHLTYLPHYKHRPTRQNIDPYLHQTLTTKLNECRLKHKRQQLN